MLNIQAIEVLHEQSGLPIQIMENDEIIHLFENKSFKPNPAYFIMKAALDTPHPVCYTITSDYYYAGLVRVTDSNIIAIVGPATSLEHDRKRAVSLLLSMGQSSAKLSAFLSWLNTIPGTETIRFRATLKMLDFLLNGVCNREPIDTAYRLVDTKAIESHTDLTSFEKYHHNKFENELSACIEFGRVEEARELLKSLQHSRLKLPVRAKDAIRVMKNTYMYSTGILSRAAARGGLSSDIVTSLSDYYLFKFESLNDYHSLYEMFINKVIDFTQRVADHRYSLNQSPLSRKISKLVGSHIYEKITPSMISKKLDMDVSYLCWRFKADTGKTISTYVNEVKILEAQRLLKNSEFSIFEISERLGFSAQNYFQSVFKKITGLTPVEYRNTD